MPKQKTKEELEDRIEKLEVENETLQDQIDSSQTASVAVKSFVGTEVLCTGKPCQGFRYRT